MIERYNFYNNKIISNECDDFIHKMTHEIITQVVKNEDDALKETLKKYAQQYAAEKEINVSLLLLDEEKVKHIIDLGINAYIKEMRGI